MEKKKTRRSSSAGAKASALRVKPDNAQVPQTPPTSDKTKQSNDQSGNQVAPPTQLPHSAQPTQSTQPLDHYVAEITLDEERLLANLAFDPLICGRQLREKHFSKTDFQGKQANRLLLGVMLDILNAEENLNLPNMLERLNREKFHGKDKIQLVGGRERVQRLFTSPFSTPGVTMLDDIDPVLERIRDRNLRDHARRLLIRYAEQVVRPEDDAFEVLSSCMQELRGIFLHGSTGYIRTLDFHLDEMRELIRDNKAKKRGYLGYDTGFPVLQERLSGFQKEFYLITGGVGMGKSTFAVQLAHDLVALNPELTVVFFTLDLNRIDVTAKLVAQTAEVPIDYVKHPYVTNLAFEKKRQEGLAKVAEMRERLFVVDESNGRIFLEDIKKLVKRVKLESGGNVAVIIDPIFKIHLKSSGMTFIEKCNYLSAELKSLSAVEGVLLIATAGLPKAISNRRPIREDLEEIMGLLYDPYVVFFLYCDYLNDFETPFLEWQWGKDNFMIPIAEALIAKNKMGGINTRTFFRFFESFSLYRECVPQEIENYSAMIENLAKFREDRAFKDKITQERQLQATDTRVRRDEF